MLPAFFVQVAAFFLRPRMHQACPTGIILLVFSHMDFLIGLLVFFFCLLGFCVWRIRRQGFSWATAKRWLLYIPLALVMIVVFGGALFYAMNKGMDDGLIVKWMNMLCTAAFVFGFAIKEFWRYRKRWTFWAELGVLVVAHFAALQRLHWEKASYFWLMLVVGIPEMVSVFFLLGLMFQPSESPPSEDPAQ